jgi:hypothetical protein
MTNAKKRMPAFLKLLPMPLRGAGREGEKTSLDVIRWLLEIAR